MAVHKPSLLLVLLLSTAAAAAAAGQAVAAATGAGPPTGHVQVLLAIAKALDPTGKALPKYRANNTKNWCKEWLAEQGCDAVTGRLSQLDISQAGLQAAAPLQGTLPRQLPAMRIPLNLERGLQISGPGITGSLPPWVLRVANWVTVTSTSVTGPLPSLPAGAAVGWVEITGNPQLSGPLPPSWASLTVIDLSNNALTGTIPNSWSSSKSLQQINLASNKLSGSLSGAWAKSSNIPSLDLLNVSGNAGMKGCLADAKGRPWQPLPFIDARKTPLLNCIKRPLAPTQSGAPHAGWSAVTCKVTGYELKVQQLPAELDSSSQKVLLYTIQPSDPAAPFPLATLAETASACDALDACVMFTSDGYLIGAYRPVEDVSALPKVLELEKRLGPWQWRTMRYCSGKCCGTWVSTRFDTRTLAATRQSHVQVGSPANDVWTPSEAPGGGVESSMSSRVSLDLRNPICVAVRAGNVSSSTCPPRCMVACCARDIAEYDGSVQVTMSNHFFEQCSTQACNGACDFEQTLSLAVSGPYTQRTIAIYLAQKSKGKPAKATPTRRRSEGCTGSLC